MPKIAGNVQFPKQDFSIRLAYDRIANAVIPNVELTGARKKAKLAGVRPC
jgi:hypothetical protein